MHDFVFIGDLPGISQNAKLFADATSFVSSVSNTDTLENKLSNDSQVIKNDVSNRK